mmetsp:Transcript_38277/g.120061  ORF Transcript_38277/g.120061 Transcript_38277/m.120061 type:complete len:225 (-) Transcript_38277:260-934(-)
MRKVTEMETEYYSNATGKLLNRANNIGEGPGEDTAALEAMEQRRQECIAAAKEKIIIADQSYDLVDKFIERLDEQLIQFEESLRNAGEFDTSTASRGDEVAMMTNPAEAQWILGKVIDYRPETGFYHVCDIEERDKRFMLPETQIQLLRFDTQERMQKGDEALGIYPDTTSFYPCIITSMPRRGAQSANSGMCTVQFQDDADEHGITPHRMVPLQYVMGHPLPP